MCNNVEMFGKTYLFLIALLVLMLAIHAAAVGGLLGYGLWWLDIVLHFLGGIWLAVLAFWFLFEYKEFPSDFLPKWLLGLGLISFVMLGGVFWEFFEFSWDYFIARPYGAILAQPDLADTMSDLFFDFAGAVVAAAYFLRYYRFGYGEYGLNSEKPN
ncbi:MAG: hypothetical protein HYY55_03730 [Candidatus Niyogibacteria bacterium]|nr:MAG: hypothetical protein HYY55_03730 [Candidatus Niyogibacteria bacterium]